MTLRGCSPHAGSRGSCSVAREPGKRAAWEGGKALSHVTKGGTEGKLCGNTCQLWALRERVRAGPPHSEMRRKQAHQRMNAKRCSVILKIEEKQLKTIGQNFCLSIEQN